MKVLFICNQNQNRSKTAEELFKNKFKTKSAGLYNEKPVTEKQISWADVIVVMDDSQRSEIAKRFPKLYMQSGYFPWIFRMFTGTTSQSLSIRLSQR